MNDSQPIPEQQPLPEDILERLAEDFGDRADAVAAMFLNCKVPDDTGKRIDDFYVRKILVASAGNEQRVHELIHELLERWPPWEWVSPPLSEYPGNYSYTFLLDSNEKRWASDITEFMAQQGYRLTKVESRPATVAPYSQRVYTWEGVTTFTGPKGELVIEEKDEQWILHGDPNELELYRLKNPIGDWKAFQKALTNFLLSKVPFNYDEIFAGLEDPPPAEPQPWWKFWK